MPDRFTVRAVIIFLGVFALVGLIGTLWLIDHDADGADLTVVAGLTGGALGSLGTILATTKAGPSEDDLRALAEAVTPKPLNVHVDAQVDTPAAPPAG